MRRSPFEALRFGLALKLSFTILNNDSARTLSPRTRAMSRNRFCGWYPLSVSTALDFKYARRHLSSADNSPMTVLPMPFLMGSFPPESSQKYLLVLASMLPASCSTPSALKEWKNNRRGRHYRAAERVADPYERDGGDDADRDGGNERVRCAPLHTRVVVRKTDGVRVHRVYTIADDRSVVDRNMKKKISAQRRGRGVHLS